VRTLLPVIYSLRSKFVASLGNKSCGSVTVVIFGLIFQRKQKGVKWRWRGPCYFLSHSFHSTTDVSARAHSQSAREMRQFVAAKITSLRVWSGRDCISNATARQRRVSPGHLCAKRKRTCICNPVRSSAELVNCELRAACDGAAEGN
jgi:hypothetical protein